MLALNPLWDRSSSPKKTVFCWDGGGYPPLSDSKENTMIEKYFSAPKTLQRLRAGFSGPHIDAADDEAGEGLEYRSRGCDDVP